MKKIVFGDRLRRITGGTKALAEKLGKELNWESGVYVEDLSEKSEGIFLSSKNEKFGPFNNVICAVQANQIKFLPNHYGLELKTLKSFPYTSGTLWIHNDMRFMPKNNKDWSALHYQVKKDLSNYIILLTPLIFLIGFYDGFFGPGTGSFFVMLFLIFKNFGLKSLNSI